MNRIDIIVPKGIRYISDWEGYSLSNYPFPHILDKVLTGCGFTEYCLTNNQNLILCSPRRMLLENKEDQHRGEIYYARNDIYDSTEYDKSLSLAEMKSTANSLSRIKSSEQLRKEEEEKKEKYEQTKQRVLQLKDGVKTYCTPPSIYLKPRKIIVTYDSFRHVKEALTEMGIIDKFQIVIDEFQSVLVDVKFKSSTELELMNQLKDLNKVCYVSATPMLEKYLNEIDEFKDLPYYRLDWEKEDPSRIINPNLNVHKSDSVFKDAVKVISTYQDNKFEVDSSIDTDTGKIKEIKSTEAVIYVNSVKSICTLIVKCGLTVENTNVLCARTDENEEKVRKAFNDALKKLGKKAKYPKGAKVIGTIPKRGEEHKMFTLCTRTVYLGADFYSTNARTFIFSDANIDCLSVDISTDLPQILGRQRLVENPWKNSADLYIKSSILALTKKDFDEELDKKSKMTENLLAAYNEARKDLKHDIANNYREGVLVFKYKNNYVAIDYHGGKDAIPVYNKLMKVAEQRTFDIQQVDYKDRVSVFNTLRNKGFSVIEVDKELAIFNSFIYYPDKMRYICNQGNILPVEKFELLLNSVPKDFKNYYIALGPDKCRTACYRKAEMEKEYQKLVGNQNIDIGSIVCSEFKVGDKLTKADIKGRLGNIYKSVGYTKTPKANDLGQWFTLKPVQFSNKDTGKRDNGFEIISKK